VLAVAFVVARTCGRVGDEVSQEKAVAIARDSIDFEPEHHQIRLFKKGLDSHPYWGVSLYNGDRSHPTRCQVVQVDAESGFVASVANC
jgi:hypothetical protein